MEDCYNKRMQIGLYFKKLIEVNKSLTQVLLRILTISFKAFRIIPTSPLEPRFDNTARTALNIMLKINKTLTHLDLSASSIFSLGDCGIFQALRHNTTLLHLNLSNTSLKATEGLCTVGPPNFQFIGICCQHQILDQLHCSVFCVFDLAIR